MNIKKILIIVLCLSYSTAFANSANDVDQRIEAQNQQNWAQANGREIREALTDIGLGHVADNSNNPTYEVSRDFCTKLANGDCEKSRNLYVYSDSHDCRITLRWTSHDEMSTSEELFHSLEYRFDSRFQCVEN